MKQILAFFSGACFSCIVACGDGPQVTVYLSDPGAQGMQFYNERTGEKGSVGYDQTDKFVCFNPQDTQQLMNYCGLGRKKN
jgi:hypothetical protein